MKNKQTQALIVIGIILLAVLGAVYAYSRQTPGGDIPILATPTPGDPAMPEEKYDLAVQLSEGGEQAQIVEHAPPAQWDPLTPEEIAQIAARLPDLPPDSAEQTGFNRPPESLPPPRPGVTIQEQFPPLETGAGPGNVEAGPLKVLRFAPEGEVPIAPFVSVTFNQPMVPIGTLGDLAAKDAPVVIEPSIPGTWRWLGTKTLTFQFDSTLIDRLPMATEYRVTVPAGTKSAAGETLSESLTWAFRTPPPKIVTTYPDTSPQPLEPIFFVAFDQRIDAQAVLETVRVTAGSQTVGAAMASEEEIQKDARVSQLVESAAQGRWLAFRAAQPLPADTSVSVSIGPGTPSAEGPLVTTQAQTFGFATYAPLKIEEQRCSWYDGRCPPLTPFYIRFNNPLDMDDFSDELIRVQPEIEGLTISNYGNSIEINGATKGRTTYTVTISGALRDAFGQTLGRDERLTFKVGKAEPVLAGPEQRFITLDPASPRTIFSVYAINYNKLNLKVYSVQPEDWAGFKNYVRDWRRTDKALKMPGRLLSDKALNLNLPADALTQVDVDLGRFMSGNSAQFVVIVEPPAGIFESEEDKYRRFSQTVIAWVQVTPIGLDAFADHSRMVAWATDLKDGAPLSGVTIRPEKGGASFLTDAGGVARFDIPEGAAYLIAQKGNDLAMLPNSVYYWDDSGWYSNPPSDELRWYVFDDRKMYRPGEEIHVKGWLRRIGGKQDGDVELVGEAANAVSYQINDTLGNVIGNGRADVSDLGGFDFVFTLPQNATLGTAQIYIAAEGAAGGLGGLQYTHYFEVQEFRRPEFEVKTRSETGAPYFAGEHAVLAVDANYYAGGALPNADVTWTVRTSPGSYSPPNWPDFIFGTWKPWWFFYDYEFGYGGFEGGETQTQTFPGKTDAAGTHYLRLDFKPQGDPGKDPGPKSVVAEASVMDVNRQAWASSTALLVHPADVYVGIRSERYFVARGAPLEIEFIVSDLDGNAVGGRPVTIVAARLEWKYKKGEWAEVEADVQICDAVSASEPGSCSFETPLGGSYQITAIVTDEQGRKNQSRFTRWVSGGERPPSRRIEQEKVTLIPDKQTYQPGDTAEILVQSPFSPAEGLLTVTRSGILYTERFHIEDGDITLRIPIEEKYIPNLNIQVDLTGAAPRTDDQGEALSNVSPRPAFATGSLTLNVPPLERTLALEVTPDQSKLEPGGDTTLTITVKDAHGRPVSDAELAVVVVDEAILALTNYSLADPVEIFYSNRPPYLTSAYGRASVVLADPQSLAQDASKVAQDSDMLSLAGAPAATEAPAMESAPIPGEFRVGNAQQPIAVRTDFNPLANFSPTVRTGLDGRARVFVELPDNLTRYRIMVVAVDDGGSRFGAGQANLTARLPLMVRPSAPRFLNFGDTFELPVVVQNQTDFSMTVDIVARASNLEVEIGGKRVTVPANDRVEVRFPSSTIMAGTTQIQFAAVSGGYADAATVNLPVYTPATSEAFATYGVIDEGALAQPVQYPGGVFPQYGGLEINTSSTALQALTDAVLYLASYPFECSEQLASRILAIASLRDVLTAFEAEGLPAPEALEARVTRDLELMETMQNSDGGFPYWRRGFDSIPFNTIHAVHAMVRAEEKGFAVPTHMKQSALEYLRGIESRYPEWYTQQTRWTLSAYALYVRDLSGDRDARKAERLLNEAGLENLSMEAVGWLWPVIDDPAQLDAIRVHTGNRVVETPGAANFTTSYSDQTYLLLSSDRRTDAILLDALMEDNPQSDLIQKVVNGLLAHRIKGRWNNTQENVFVLIALDRYFNTYESQTPDFVAKIWLGDTYAGSAEFRGRTTERRETFIPMAFVLSETGAPGGSEDLILSKDGPGRLYYRIGLRYAPTDLKLDPLDMGFVVQREYEAVDDPADVTRDANGAWHIKAGARVKVKITMVADNRRYHVALVDPLPAGLEIVNPALAVSGSLPQNPNTPDFRHGWWWWWGPWYEHQNLRDDRAEAFASLLWDGVYEYVYFARATTPGSFVVPPAKAEEMYSPEVFGRSGSDVVIIE